MSVVGLGSWTDIRAVQGPASGKNKFELRWSTSIVSGDVHTSNVIGY